MYINNVNNSKSYNYYSKNRKVYSYEITLPNEYKEYVEKKKKTRNLMRHLDEVEKEKYELEHKVGYCSKCGCLKSLNGTCPICD